MSDRRHARGLRLRHQLTLVSLLPVVLLGLVAILVSIYALQQVSLSLILQRNTALVQVAAAGLAKDLSGYLVTLQATAARLADHAGTLQDQRQVLEEWEPLLRPFEGGVALLDETGVAIATTPGHEERLGLDYSFRDYFQAVRETQRPTFSAVLQEVPSGEDAVVIATPAPENDGFAGLLLGVLFLGRDTWVEALEPLRTPQGGQVYLIDRAGNIIYHPDAAWVGRSILEDTALCRLVVERQPGSVLRESPYFDERVVASFAPLPGVGWGLILEEPWSAILSPTLAYPWAVGGLLLLGVLVSLSLLAVSVGRVTRPLSSLAEQARQVSTGAPFHPLTVQGSQEVSTLIRAFNQMVIRLAEQQATLRRYAIQVLQGQEEERRRISRELHDETVQDLVGLVQRIELYRGALEQNPETARRRLDDLQSLAEQAVADVRRMSNDLRPSILEDLGLSAALQALSDELAHDLPQARAHCEIVGDERRLAPELELTVFRVVQEALNNVRKHARSATQVHVTLYFESWGVLVTIEDDGPGLQTLDVHALAREGHLGLAGMIERAQLFGGEIDITAAPGEGTTISLQVADRRGTHDHRGDESR